MAAAVEHDRPPEELRAVLTEGAAGTRNAIRQLRSLLLEIYPPALRDQGLAAALPDLAAPLTARGIDVSMDVQERSGAAHRGRAAACSAPPRRRSATQARTRPQATSGSASSAATALVRLRVSDDGRGFDQADLAERRADGHLGLDMLRRPCRRRPAARCR